MRADGTRMPKEMGGLLRDSKKEEAEKVKAKVPEMGAEMEA